MDYKDSIVTKLHANMADLTIEKIGKIGLENAENNMSHILYGKSVLKLRETNIYQSNKALVIAAGPSLHRYDFAKIIKESCYDGMIITTESSMSWCLRNNIKPDLVVTVDPHPERIVRWFGDPDLTIEKIKDDDYFSRQDMDPEFINNQYSFNSDLVELVNKSGHGINIAISSSASSAVVNRAIDSGMNIYWWNPYYDDFDAGQSLTRTLYDSNHLPCINAGGNVGTAAWVIAHSVLDIKNIGLLGFDFSYYADTTYKQTQYYNELLDIFGVNNIDKAFMRFMNPQTNTEFFTDPAYYWYRESFLEMAAMASADGVKTFNLTNGGILFGENIILSSLKEFMK